MATEAAEFGIQIGWSGELTVGDFAADGKYIVAPSGVSIESISPKSSDQTDWVVAHGAELNPWPRIRRNEQGFMKMNDSFPGIQISSNEWLPYEASIDVAAGVSPASPLVLMPGDSLVCTISMSQAYMDAPPQGGVPVGVKSCKIQTAAVFTVVASAPPAGTFRPGYAGNDKDLSVNISQINWSALGPGVALPPDAVALVEGIEFVERHVERPWLSLHATWRARGVHPMENLARFNHNTGDWGEHGYSRGLSTEYGDVVCTLIATDFSQSEKATLMARAIQVGLDLFAVTQHDSGISTGTTANTITCTEKSWPVDRFKNSWVWMQNGNPPDGRYARVLGNDGDTLTIDEWSALWDGSRDLSPQSTPASGEYFRVGCPYGIWQGDGGHSSGRFLPILFAGTMLGRQDMIDLVKLSDRYWDNGGQSSGICFGELHQTFYVEETSPGEYNYNSPGNENAHPEHEYRAEDVGMPEWGHGHGDPATTLHPSFGINGPLHHSKKAGSQQGEGSSPPGPDGDSRAIHNEVLGEIKADTYRWCCTACSWVGTALAVLAIPGMKANLNHNAFLDYMDRFLDGFGIYYPNGGQAITSYTPPFTGNGGVWASWFGRGGRSSTITAGGVVYDTWHGSMWNLHRASLPLVSAMSPAIVQSATNGGDAGNHPFNWELTTTLGSATTNGNYLVMVVFRGAAAADAETPFISGADAGDWTIVVDQALSSGTGAHVLVAIRPIVAAENSCEVNATAGSGTPENWSMALFEVSPEESGADLEVIAQAVYDPGDQGVEIPLTEISVQQNDLLIAAGQIHDDDGITPSWSNGFGVETENLESGGVPDQTLVTGSRIADATAQFGATLSWGTPPGSVGRAGVLIGIRSVPAGQVIESPTSIASAEAFGVPTIQSEIDAPTSIASAEAHGTPEMGLGIGPASIGSEEAFGAAEIARTIEDAGAIGSEESFGTPTTSQGIEDAGAIGSEEAFGAGNIGSTIEDAGAIASAEAFSKPVFAGGVPPVSAASTLRMDRRVTLRMDR